MTVKTLDDLQKQVTEMEGELDGLRKQLSEAPDPAELDALKAQIETLTGDLAKAKARASMSDEERDFADDMDDDDAKKFMALDKAGRTEAITKARAGDETVTVEGTVISKSKVGATQFAVFKSLAEKSVKQDEAIAKANDERDTALFTKRADDELSLLPGETPAKASMLKAINAMPEADRKTLETILKAANDTAKAGPFTRLGYSNDKDGVLKGAGDPGQPFRKRMDDLRTANPKLSKVDVMRKAQAEAPADEFAAYQGAQQ